MWCRQETAQREGDRAGDADPQQDRGDPEPKPGTEFRMGGEDPVVIPGDVDQDNEQGHEDGADGQLPRRLQEPIADTGSRPASIVACRYDGMPV